MWRYLAGAGAALAMAGAGALLLGRGPHADAVLPAAPSAQASPGSTAEPLPATVPEASNKTREDKRFDRYDKDRDGSVTREEYLMQRRKAFAKLDTNHDGTLSFDEWAVKAETKFTAADRDKSNAMTRAEFATTAVKRKPARPRRDCPPAQAAASPSDD